MQVRRKSKTKKKSYEWPDYISNALKNLAPPERITVSEWAEKYRILDSKSSARPGPWRNNVTPYLTGIMDEFNSVTTEEIIFVKPTQVGGTEALQNAVGYAVMQDPSPMIIVYPTEDLAESVSENRLQPMLKLSPELRKRFKPLKTSKMEIQCEDMYITLAGANSPSGLSSRPVKYVLLDEVDKFPGATKKEASPIKLAQERTKTFMDRKIFLASTPTIRTGQIWKAKDGADIEKHFFVPCPHCAEEIELKFQQIKWSQDEKLSYIDRAETAKYVCQICGGIIEDRHKPMMLNQGVWNVVKERTQFPRKVAFWMNTLYSPFVKFSEIAKEFLTTKDDPEEFQNFVNSWLAEPWEDTKLKTTAETVLEAQTEYEEFVVPPYAEFLTAGIDVQENSLYWTIRAWGKHITSQNIAHGQAQTFAEVERIMNLEYAKPDGTPMIVSLAAMDSGDQTDIVYDFCVTNEDWAIPVKGRPAGDNNYKISTINKAGSNANGMRLLLVSGGNYKDMIAARMKKKPGERGAWSVYKDCDQEYAEQVTAEHKINVKGSSGKKQMWIPKTSHADNHYLDCEVYAFAAAELLGVRTLHLNEIEESENEPVNEKQLNEQAIELNDSWLNGKSWL